MEPFIYLVRHAEAEHNISKQFSQRDPPLTQVGIEQASSLETTFPEPRSIAIVLTSPLKRALQTTLAGFSHVIALDRDDTDNGIRNARPNGSKRALLEEAFPSVDFSMLDKDWFLKTGIYAADEESVALRAKAFREKLWGLADSVQREQPMSSSHSAIVVVTHGVFMKYLTLDKNIDLPKAGWQTFRLVKITNGEVILSPV
ncbi:phosphoglycerate mutase family protein [Pochonia chlamydosporia 170]|uniref:Phosphoglycerate mutase family protein n=1 Tax=Pochonia chlamydosporia 170 TaxID=1380566 RepID=A0A179FRH9_METCM|nr:phosphoglycerate mutase family protein [Pochonia chlamydosporia 170]OAQ67741.1 phosphoglycerate mutase family protein [Pochonia chlamydosporia 170]